MPKWGEPGDVGRVDRIALRGEVVEGGLDLYGLPQHNDVDHDAEAVELVFLPDLGRVQPNRSTKPTVGPPRRALRPSPVLAAGSGRQRDCVFSEAVDQVFLGRKLRVL